MQYQIRLGPKEIQLWSKETAETHWQNTPLAELGVDLPDLKVAPWSEEKLEEETKKYYSQRGKHQCTPPQQPRPQSNFSWVQEMEHDRGLDGAEQDSLDSAGEGSSLQSSQ